MQPPRNIQQVEYRRPFIKQLGKLPIKVQEQTKRRIAEFTADENAEALRDHALTGKLSRYRSINITGDVRALYYLREDGTIVVFVFIGTHSQLYR